MRAFDGKGTKWVIDWCGAERHTRMLTEDVPLRMPIAVGYVVSVDATLLASMKRTFTSTGPLEVRASARARQISFCTSVDPVVAEGRVQPPGPHWARAPWRATSRACWRIEMSSEK